jgi:uncharacterized protein YciU (UPF0263 family)
MTTTNDMSVLYIPDFVFPTDVELIKKRFMEEGYGVVDDVELVKQWECELNVDDDLYSAAFVTVGKWNDNEKTQHFKNMIQDKNIEARLTHGEDDYWEFELANFKNTVYNDVEHEHSDHSSCTHNETDNFSKLEDLNSRIYYLENNLLYSTNGVNYLLNVNREKAIKKERKNKQVKLMKERRKAQRMWRDRLRPLDKLKSVKTNY